VRPSGGETRPNPDAAKPIERLADTTALKSSTRLSGLAKETAGRKVVSGETLGKIANETRMDGVSFDQMVVALFRQNRDAFDGDNMNRLKAGKILAIPEVEAAKQVSDTEARKEVVAQAADFNAFRKKLSEAAAAAPVKDQDAKQLATGKIAPKVEDKTPPVGAGKDKLEVSRSESAKDASGKQLPGRVAAIEEDLAARGKALKDASSRIAELEKNIQGMKKLAELKSQAGTDLQAQSAKPAEPAKVAPTPAPITPAAPVIESPKSAETPKPVEAVKPAPAPKPPPPKALPPPEPDPTFVEDNGPLLLGGGGVLAFLLGWFGYAAYRKKRSASAMPDDAAADNNLSPNSVFSAGPAAPPPSEQETSQFSATNAMKSMSAEALDPVTEADTFLAFGRDAQAEEILLEALKADPNRQAIHLKLLDIYFGRKNQSQFAAIAGGFHALVGGQGSDWAKVAAMGREIDPGNVLYGGAQTVQAAPIAEEADFGATMVLQAPVLEAPPEPTVPPAAPQAPEVESVDMPTAGDAETAVLDFDLDLGSGDETPAEAVVPVEAASEVAALDIDFDMTPPSSESASKAQAERLDMMLETGMFESPASPAEEALAPPEALKASESDSAAIDFEFELQAPESGAKSPPPELDFEFPAMDTPAAPPAMAALDLGAISLELDTLPEPEAESKPLDLLAGMPDEVDATSAAVGPVTDNPEVATKLELATAYEEMGDRDGARELYEEAVKDGSPSQQDHARAKLASLG